MGSSEVADKIRAIDGSVKSKLSSSKSKNLNLYKFIQANDRGRGSCTSPRALALRGGSEVQNSNHLNSNILFSVECDSTHLGESVGVVGECDELGIWEKDIHMTTDAQQWPSWKVNVTMNHEYADSLAYKYVKLRANDSIIQWEWESGDNRHICTKNPKDSKGSDLKDFDGSFGYTLIPTHASSSILSSQFPTACLEEEGTTVNEHGEALTPIYESMPPVNDLQSTKGGE